MTRPLVVTDCDEVLLYMVRHFRDWLDRVQDIDFALEGDPFVQAMTRRGSDEKMTEEQVWALLGEFFDTEMHSQTPIIGALEAIKVLQKDADVAVLTNLMDKRNGARRDQLLGLGLDVPIYTNQGPKGAALQRIVEHYGAEKTVFIDDIAGHHQSAFEVTSTVFRLHFCGEPAIAPHIPCAGKAGHAHARIDTWDEALPWIMETLHGDAT